MKITRFPKADIWVFLLKSELLFKIKIIISLCEADCKNMHFFKKQRKNYMQYLQKTVHKAYIYIYFKFNIRRFI